MSTRCSEGPRLTSEPQGGCSPRMGPALDLERPFRPQGQLFQRFFPRLQPWAWLETLSESGGRPRSPACPGCRGPAPGQPEASMKG